MELDNLRYAVVKQACKDYKSALNGLHRMPGNPNLLRVVADCEEFFSNEIELYSELDGKTLMRRIREEVEDRWKHRKRI